MNTLPEIKHMRIDDKIIKQELRVSIVVPVYMVEKYLRQCIESIIAQTYTNLEIILVDDGSFDNCPEICEEYASKDQRIKVIHKKNGGLTSARKAGIRAATGEYVLYVDSDDWIDDDYVEKLLNPLTIEKVDVVSTIGVYKNYSDGRQIEQTTHMKEGVYLKDKFIKEVYPYYICEEKFYDTSMSTSVYLYLFRREFLETIQEQVDDSISMGEDMALTFRALLTANSIAVKKAIGYHYRQRHDSMLHKRGVDHFHCVKLLYNNLKKALGITSDKERIKAMRKKIPRGIFFTLWTSVPSRFAGISGDFLFPYPQIKHGSKIFVYGMGVVGYGIMEFIVNSINYVLVGCSDKGWQEYDNGFKISANVTCPVYPPNRISCCDFDYIIIGVSRYRFRQEIEEKLISYGVPKNKIALLDERLLVEENLPF